MASLVKKYTFSNWVGAQKARAQYTLKRKALHLTLNKTCLYWQPTHASRTPLACVNESVEDPRTQALSAHVTELQELNKVSVNFTLENTAARNSFPRRRCERGQRTPAPGETTGRQAFLLLLAAQSSDPPAPPCGTGDGPAHVPPPAAHGLQPSSFLPQPLIFTVYVKYLHCNNSVFFSIFPPAFAFPSSLPRFADHRPKARLWQESVALAGTAAGWPACPPYASPRKFFFKRTRRVQAPPLCEERS